MTSSEDPRETEAWEREKALPEITEVQRLTWKPGDRIVVRTEDVLTARQASDMQEIIRARLALPDDVRFIVLGRGMSLEVIEGL
jgi:hypothetical protein